MRIDHEMVALPPPPPLPFLKRFRTLLNILKQKKICNLFLLFNLKGSPFKVYIHLIKGMLIGMNELHASCVWKWASCIISSCVWKWALMYPCCMGLTCSYDEAWQSYTWLGNWSIVGFAAYCACLVPLLPGSWNTPHTSVACRPSWAVGDYNSIQKINRRHVALPSHYGDLSEAMQPYVRVLRNSTMMLHHEFALLHALLCFAMQLNSGLPLNVWNTGLLYNRWGSI